MLSHPQIVPVYEFGCVGKIDFIAYAWIEGVTLGDWLEEQGGTVRGKTAAKIVTGLARAMHYAHERGIVHRDMKPANVLVDQSRDSQNQPIHLRTRITDLGLSRDIFDDDQRLTQTGQAIGTPTYMSPEQARGDSEISVGTDIYSLGVVLFELLTGRVPFECNNAIETIKAIHETPAPLVTKFDPSISKKLAAIVDACLRKEPGKRYRTAFDLAEDLDAYLTGRSVSVRTAGPVQRMTRWVSRNQYLASTIALIGLSLVIGLVSTAWQRNLAISNAARAEAHLENTTIAIDILLKEIVDKGEPSLVTKGQREVLNEVLKLQERMLGAADNHKVSKSRVDALYRASRIHKALGQYELGISMLNSAQTLEFDESDLNDKELVETMLALFEEGIRSFIQVDRGGEAAAIVDEMEGFFKLSHDLFDEVETQGYQLIFDVLRSDAYFNANDDTNCYASCRLALQKAVWLIESGNADPYRVEIATSIRRSARKQAVELNLDHAMVTFETAIKLLEEELLDHPNSNYVRNELARAYELSAIFENSTLKQHDKAEKQLNVAIEIIESLTAEAPKNPAYVVHLAEAYNDLASHYIKYDVRYDSALELIDRVVGLKQKGLLSSNAGKDRLIRTYRLKCSALEAKQDFDGALAAGKIGTELADLYFADPKSRNGLVARSELWIHFTRLLCIHGKSDVFFENSERCREFFESELAFANAKRTNYLKEAKTLLHRYTARLHATDGRFSAALESVGRYSEEPWHYHDDPSVVGKQRYVSSAFLMSRVLGIWQKSGRPTNETYDAAVLQALDWMELATAKSQLPPHSRLASLSSLEKNAIWSPIRNEARFKKIVSDLKAFESNKD